MVIASNFGARLRAIRAWRGLSQKELAESVGTYSPVLSRIEAEIVLPTEELAAAIKRALKWNEALEEIHPTHKPQGIYRYRQFDTRL